MAQANDGAKRRRIIPAAIADAGPVAVGEEPAFPRGGGGLLSPLERRQITADAEAAALQDSRFGSRGAKAGKRPTCARGEHVCPVLDLLSACVLLLQPSLL